MAEVSPWNEARPFPRWYAGRDDLGSLVCWHSSKVTESVYFGKHGWNYSKWHVLKPGDEYRCLCGGEVHLASALIETDATPDGPVADTEGRLREPCARCFAIRSRMKGSAG